MKDVYTLPTNGRSTSMHTYPLMKSKKSLALFDFDGTITTHDTLFEFIKFSKGKIRFYLSLILLSPILLLFKIKLLSAGFAKEALLSFFFKGVKRDVFQNQCTAFVRKRLSKLIRKKAFFKILEHVLEGDRVIIVSASPENWVGEWATHHGLEFIATQLEVKSGVLTGKLLGKNCNGQEKVNRIKNYLSLNTFQTIHTYGDTENDWPMLRLGSKINYKPFRD